MNTILKDLSQEQLREAAVALSGVYDKLATISELPLPEIDKASKDLLSQEKMPERVRALAERIAPGVRAIRLAEVKQITRWAMFKAAIAVCENGQAALSNETYKDPFAGQPFSYEKTPHGFRLQSKPLDSKEKPLTLEVGHDVGK